MKPRIQPIVARHLAALAFRDDSAAGALSPAVTLLLVAVHLAGMSAFWRYFHQPLWLAIPSLALFLALPWFTRARRPLSIETLAPLFLLYGILIARYVAIRVVLAREPYQDEASWADPRLIFFQVEPAAVMAFAYTALVQVRSLFKGAARTRGLVALAGLLTISAVAWFGVETIGHRTRGVTATDPYAYAQMAVDLATRGTPLHEYPLFADVMNTTLAWYPIEHMGYRLFDNRSGWVPSVWPVGGAVWLAVAYRWMGEEGLYLATPIASLLALLALGLLAWEYWRDRPTVERCAVVAASVALLATSWEQVDRSIVPLVDTQAQLFSILAIWMALLSTRRTRVGWWGLGTGLALGAAYFVRHTQVLLAVPILLLAWPQPRTRRWTFLAATTAAALIAALPDLWYHQAYMGGWFTPESHELALFSISSLLPSARSLGERFFAGNEFGYLFPFLGYGAYRAARERPAQLAALAAWLFLLTGFHLLYAAVKIRDLLPEFPVVVLLTAYGLVALARDVRERSRGHAGRGMGWRDAGVALCIAVALLAPALRTRLTILRPFGPPKVTFGYVTGAQRAEMNRLAALTPPNAVIGSTLNDGAIDLYSRRLTFRPGGWQAPEQSRFIETMRAAGRPVFVLNDGNETGETLLGLAERYALRPVATLDVPLFGEAIGAPGVLWEIGPYE